MKLRLCLGLFTVLGFAPGEILSRRANSGLPAWLKLGGEERVRWEELGGVGSKPGGNGYPLQRLRLSLDMRRSRG